MTKGPFVSAEWLHERLGAPDIVVVDASWYLPAQNRDPDAEYRAGHIPGAVRFDIDTVRDTKSSLPHMMPVARSLRGPSRSPRHRRRHEDRGL
jgi:thiosulfate/3-mercaptopyruvate sulfurtransferase